MFTSAGENIFVYVKTTDGLRQVWSSTRNDVKWAHQYVDLGRIDADEFSVIFHVRFGSLCRTSVGLDNVKFHPCTVGECVASMWLIQVRLYLKLNGNYTLLNLSKTKPDMLPRASYSLDISSSMGESVIVNCYCLFFAWIQ